GRIINLVLVTPGLQASPEARQRLWSMIDTMRGGKPPVSEGEPAPLRVAMTGSYWPLHVTGPDDKQRYGFEAELAEALAHELGTRATWLISEEIGSGGSLKAVAEG